jgi:hypothetical protein
MRAKIALLMGGAALNLLLGGCGGGNRGADMPPAPSSMPNTMALDTAALLGLIETKTSDTAQPMTVDNGAVAVTPAGDEAGVPISVNAP